MMEYIIGLKRIGEAVGLKSVPSVKRRILRDGMLVMFGHPPGWKYRGPAWYTTHELLNQWRIGLCVQGRERLKQSVFGQRTGDYNFPRRKNRALARAKQVGDTRAVAEIQAEVDKIRSQATLERSSPDAPEIDEG